MKVGDLVRHTEFKKLMGIIVKIEIYGNPRIHENLVTVCCTGADRISADRVCFHQYDWEVLSESR